MKEIELLSTDGEVYTNPTQDFVTNLILNGGHEYWINASDQAVITKYIDGKEVSQLILTYSKEYEFQVEFRNIGVTYYVSLGSGNFEKTTIVNIGGDGCLLPSKFFITKEKANQVTLFYLNTGKMADQISWGDLTEINWHYGMD